MKPVWKMPKTRCSQARDHRKIGGLVVKRMANLMKPFVFKMVSQSCSFVGVNGVGKTTSIGKLAHRYKQEGKKVMLVAADTFRAGAVAQLAEWGRRVDVPVVTGPEKSDPASVVFDGMERAIAETSMF